ncbi:ubiquitin-like domain-containing CTD phosphatase 1 [Brachionus plicatilis]|uniref:Ubiquitin-like domain-containing CTD phosphatase 1 n=1 Tax=Brachionus plicatilis TaxID=10195 RepID=A0A3M7SKN8_BRAPC|nr:ubiquitin-like domain-containing CTD phosphatase 1 [Brachionus plicatilis]
MSTHKDFVIKWNGQDYNVPNLLISKNVADLKEEIFKLTNVLPQRQKLLGLKTKNGQAAADSHLIDELNYKANTKILMMGTQESIITDINTKPENLPQVVDDFDIDNNVEVSIQNREENLAKIARRVREYKLNILNEPRPNKRLLVLDIDYTIFDHVSHAERGEELMRPYFHQFMASAYEDYDIVIWSATSMKWIQAKMEEMGATRNPNYKISFYLDSSAMISVYTSKFGLLNVKPLKVIWDKMPEFYSPKNTIMFDDLRRNFLMNPENGLKIQPYKNAHVNREKDQELLKLSVYLKKISKLSNFSEVDHKSWSKYV